MSRHCDVTGKRPMFGNNVSHANNKTRIVVIKIIKITNRFLTLLLIADIFVIDDIEKNI